MKFWSNLADCVLAKTFEVKCMINWLVFITEAECIYWAVRAESLSTMQGNNCLLIKSAHVPHERLDITKVWLTHSVQKWFWHRYEKVWSNCMVYQILQSQEVKKRYYYTSTVTTSLSLFPDSSVLLRSLITLRSSCGNSLTWLPWIWRYNEPVDCILQRLPV
jgi:hypothetical protein